MFDITKIVIGLLGLALTALVIYCIPCAKAFAKEKLGDYKYNQLMRFTRIAVEAAEQTFAGSGRGAEKKAAVIAFLREKGFTVDAAELDAFIESAVLQLKNSVLG